MESTDGAFIYADPTLFTNGHQSKPIVYNKQQEPSTFHFAANRNSF